MISALVGAGPTEEGLEILDLMESLDLEIRASNWNSVIVGCIRSRDVELAMRVLGQMVGSMRADFAV